LTRSHRAVTSGPAYNDGMRPALLYLPGLDGTGRLLHRQPRLHDLYEVHCASYPQDRPSTYDELADVGVRLLEAGPGRVPAVILAESLGGGVALTLALRRPDLVERLLLVNTFAHFPRRLLIHVAALLGRLLPDRPSPPRTRPLRGRFFFSDDIPQPERDAWWERTADVPMSAFAHRLQMIPGLDLRPRLSEIDVPALVLAAPDDRVVPARAGRDLARRLPRGRLLSLRVGHAALVHPRVDVAELLRDERYWCGAGTRDHAPVTSAATRKPV
jgi:pimeloyl-ACP methyl ester carboxylesterase